MLSHVIPQFLAMDRIPAKLQLTGMSRLIFKLILISVNFKFHLDVIHFLIPSFQLSSTQGQFV